MVGSLKTLDKPVFGDKPNTAEWSWAKINNIKCIIKHGVAETFPYETTTPITLTKNYG